MKKLLRIILTFAMCFALGLAFTACSSGSNNPSEGLTFTLINNGTEYEVSDIGDCTDEDVIIPSAHKGLPVTSIGKAAFFNCDDLTSVKIPESVTSIGKSAFYECSNLTSINIPESVKRISDEAFYECRSLTGINIPDSVTSVGDRAFCHCNSLTSIKIPENVISIGDYAFFNCSGFKRVTIPNSVTSIGEGAFLDCDRLTSVTFENTVGWRVGNTSVDVTNAEANATYFKDTYYDFAWKRSEA